MLALLLAATCAGWCTLWRTNVPRQQMAFPSTHFMGLRIVITSPEPGAATGVTGIGGAAKPPATQPPKHSPAHYLWAALIARIYEVFPLICPICAGQMRIIAFITDGAEVRKILEHIGADSLAPRIRSISASVGDR